MIIGLIMIILLVGVDQGTKHFAKHVLIDGDMVTWIPEVLTFKYIENRGAAWGMFEGKTFFFFIITLIALAAFGYLFTKSNFKRKKVYSIAVALLIAGTLGNAIDRLFLGYVIDFIHIPFLTYILNVVGLSNFWFNIADLCLTLGIVLFAIDIIFLESKRKSDRDVSIYERMEDQTE